MEAMPTYKLTYFNARGRAEVTRYMFKMSDVEFEDHRIEGTWQEVKPTTPFGQLPVMEVDGVVICQSSAIERLIARRLGLYGKDDMEQAKSDMVVGCVEDVFQAMMKTNQGTDEEKTEKKKKFAEEQLPTMLNNLEKMMNTDGNFINKTLMWADIAVAHVMSYPQILQIEFDISKFQKISVLVKKVESEPKIAVWIKDRPPTRF